MAEITSLGVHAPVGLSYLVEEGILPKDPKPDLYQWQTYVYDDGQGDVEEEVLATKDCVVWSQGKYIRNVYRFELEGEDVVQALLTEFPSARSGHTADVQNHKELRPFRIPDGPQNQTNGRSGRHEIHGESAITPETTSDASPRALVVLLKTKAHIHFLRGSSHIVDLPFAFSKAFAAPRGLVLQRKPTPVSSLPPTPQYPKPPPNSFLSSQLWPSSSYLQSPTFAKSFGGSQPFKPSPLGSRTGLDAIFQDALGSAGQTAEDDVLFHYTLTNPLSDFGEITYSVQHQRPRLSGKTQASLSVDFEALDAADEVVYVSSRDELGNAGKKGFGRLMLIVTVNCELHTLSVWHAWYIDEKSLASLLKQRKAHKDAKARRRSSFLSANMGTGATTPAVRHREPTRENLAAASSMRVPAEPTASQTNAASSRKPTRQEEEEVMASQMDPDYQPNASQQSARESRRISSLNADMRASQTNPNASFGAHGGRRNASMGGPNERKSFGHRKSRGSTPGSIFSRSLGPEDDLMEVDSSMDADGEETVDSIVRHIRATFEAAGAENIFGNGEEGFKRELVVRKLHSVPLSSEFLSPNCSSSAIRVLTMKDTHLQQDEDQRLNVYIHDLVRLQLRIRHRHLWLELEDSPVVAIPTLTGESKLQECTDMTKLKYNGTEAILLADQGLLLSVDDTSPWPLATPPPYRFYDPADAFSSQTQRDRDIGKNRTLEGPGRDRLKLTHPGAEGRFGEVGQDGIRHRRRLKLRPDDDSIGRLLDVCRLLLPAEQGRLVTGLWYQACISLATQPGTSRGTAENTETLALVATLLSFAIHLVDEKSRAALNLSRVAAGGSDGRRSQELSKGLHEKSLSRRKGWSWMGEVQQSPDESVSTISSVVLKESRKDQLLVVATTLADEMIKSADPEHLPGLATGDIIKLMLGLHVFREEQKLCCLASRTQTVLAVVIAQLGGWLNLPQWSYGKGQYLSFEGADEQRWIFVKSHTRSLHQMPLMDEPVGVYQWFEHALQTHAAERYPTLDVIIGIESSVSPSQRFLNNAVKHTHRIAALSDMLGSTSGFTASATTTVELMVRHGITTEMMESLPTAIAAPFKEAIARCEREPPTTWTFKMLELVEREDLDITASERSAKTSRLNVSNATNPRDVQTVCHALDQQPHSLKTREADRHAVSQLIFSEDRRLVEATSLMHFNSVQVAECPKQPDWSDAQHFEQQRKIMQWVTVRMIALPAGDAMIHYDCQTPLLTDKYHLAGFSNSCQMQPMGHTLTTDRSGLTEEKVNWAYFHAGVSAGLRISRNVKGIDTSWVAFNKPNDLTNRHAGLLLALGLSGHLRNFAKWLSFKYLTPKHTMTSCGLLLGLSASYMGTTDGLITRMLSVHITRMLPPGAAELNVSPTTQTAGLMGIGLLYYNTQHRRMSEIMLSEIEHMALDDPDNGLDPLRDESYRLAAGFALGFINLGRGRDMRGLHGMYLPERLLAVAVGPRPVDAVHVFDKATAGAVIAIALVYMKSGDSAMARKIDIPDTSAQFDHVRPDILMVRAMARHIIIWKDIEAQEVSAGFPPWIYANLPSCYRDLGYLNPSTNRHPLKSSDVPFFNIVTGLAWALSLKYAGSSNVHARDEILTVLDYFYTLRPGANSYYYDAKLAQSTVRRCIDVLALAAATVMAGTGDLRTFRYLRRLHGRTDSETPYGSHLAAHLAIGALFLGGGTYTFSTSDLAVASLICAFWPLFPTDVHDNHVHLQAFRHLWVFAAEARCLVVEDIDTHRPISMPIIVSLRDGTQRSLTTPCLLPELDNIASVQTSDPAYWRVSLDFQSNADHLAAFRQDQRILVRRCPASEAHDSIFSSTLAALNDAQASQAASQIWHSIFHLPVFKGLDKADLEVILPPDVYSSVHTDERSTVVDDRLALAKAGSSRDRDDLWNLRLLFAWAEKARDGGDGRLRWIESEVIEKLNAKVEELSR